MSNNTPKYKIRKAQRHDGKEIWVVEYNRIVQRVEQVIIPLEEVPIDQPDQAIQRATEIMGVRKENVKVQTQ